MKRFAKRCTYPLFLLLVAGSAFSQQFIDASMGTKQVCGVTSDGALFCNTRSDALRVEPPTDLPPLLQVEAGEVHSCALDLDGRPICWGDNNFGQLNVPANVSFDTIHAGLHHTCGVTTDLETVCWGLDSNGRLDVPTDALPFVQVQAGQLHSCGLEAAGGIRCWGARSFRWDPIGANADIQKFAATVRGTNSNVGAPQLCALLDDGSIECQRFYSFSGSYSDIAATDSLMCGLTIGGDIECQNRSFNNGEFLPLPQAFADELAEINNGDDVVSIFGNKGLCAITTDGDVSCSAGASGISALPAPSVTQPGPLAADDLRVSIYSDNAIELFWTAIGNAGSGNVAGAEIYRDGELLATTDNETSFIDDSLLPGVTYVYQIRLINTLGAVGPSSNSVSVDTNSRNPGPAPGSYTPPDRPANPTSLQSLVYSSTTLELVWDRPQVFVFGYEIYRDHQLLTFTNGTSVLDSTLEPGQTYHYDIVAVDRDGKILGFAGILAGGG